MEQRHSRWAAAVVALACASGCGGGAGPEPVVRSTTPVEEATPPARSGPVSARGDREVRARVGSAGGTLELANGVRLEIPAGALDTDLEVLLRVAAPGREAWEGETKRPLGPVVDVEPAIVAASGHLRFSAPALPLPEGFQLEDLALGVEEEVGGTHLGAATQTRWQVWPARIDGSRFVAEVPAVGGHRLQFGVSR